MTKGRLAEPSCQEEMLSSISKGQKCCRVETVQAGLKHRHLQYV